jgi:hypothetical protein
VHVSSVAAIVVRRSCTPPSSETLARARAGGGRVDLPLGRDLDLPPARRPSPPSCTSPSVAAIAVSILLLVGTLARARRINRAGGGRVPLPPGWDLPLARAPAVSAVAVDRSNQISVGERG